MSRTLEETVEYGINTEIESEVTTDLVGSLKTRVIIVNDEEGKPKPKPKPTPKPKPKPAPKKYK